MARCRQAGFGRCVPAAVVSEVQLCPPRLDRGDGGLCRLQHVPAHPALTARAWRHTAYAVAADPHSTRRRADRRGGHYRRRGDRCRLLRPVAFHAAFQAGAGRDARPLSRRSSASAPTAPYVEEKMQETERCAIAGTCAALVTDFCHAADQADGGAAAVLFAPDGEWVSGRKRGRRRAALSQHFGARTGGSSSAISRVPPAFGSMRLTAPAPSPTTRCSRARSRWMDARRRWSCRSAWGNGMTGWSACPRDGGSRATR